PPGHGRHREQPMTPPPDVTVDGTGLLCVTLLLGLRAVVDAARPGSVVHVLAVRPAMAATASSR
ncbi:hypothetical protein ACH5AM_05665, partial [Streptomyces sp. NPDC018957]